MTQGKRWRKIAIWTILVVLVLGAGLTILFFTSPGQQSLLRRLESVGERAGVPFTAEGLDVQPLDLSFSFSTFRYNKDGVTLNAKNLKVDLPWNAWGVNGWSISSLTADEVDARVVSGTTTESAEKPGAGAGEEIKLPLVRIGLLDVKKGRFVYETAATRVEIPAFSIKVVDGSGKILTGAPVAIDANTRVSIPEIPIALAPDGLRFGPVNWSVTGVQTASGSASGEFQWTPLMRGKAEFKTDPIALDTWDGITLQGRLEYDAGVVRVPEFTARRGAGVLTGSAAISEGAKSANVRWNDVRIDPVGVAGVTSGQMVLQWQASDFSDARGSGDLRIRADEYGVADSVVTIEDGRARFEIDATAMGAAIHANAVTGLDRQLSGTFNVTHREYGVVTAEGTIAGTLTSPEASANIVARDVTIEGIGPAQATAQASYRDKVLLVNQVGATLRNSTLVDGNLRIDLESRAIDGAVPSITAQLSDFISDAAGEVRAVANVSGTLDAPVASFTASAAGLDIGGTSVDTFTAEARLKDNVLEITQLIAKQRDGELQASGEVNLKTEEVAGRASISNLRITETRGFSATVNLTADISGTTRKPSGGFQGTLADVIYEGQEHGAAQFTGTMDTETVRATVQSEKYRTSLEGLVSLAAPYTFSADLTVDRGAFQYQQYSGEATGRVIAGGVLEPLNVDRLELQAFQVKAHGVELTASGSLETGILADGVADLASLPVSDLELTGRAQLEVLVKGPLNRPLIDGSLRTVGATARATGMTEAARIEAAIDFARDRFEIREMRANYADAEIVINGEGSLDGAGEIRFSAANIRPERFLPDRPLAGVVALEGDLRFSAPRLDAIEGRATVTRLEITAGGVEFHQTAPGEVVYAGGALAIKNFALTGPETTASLNGSVNPGTGSIDLDLRADTDLRIIEGFLPRSNAAGRINSEVTIRGDFSQPNMSGFVRLTDAHIQITEFALLISETNADIRLSGNRFDIQRAAGDVNGGPIEISGGGEISPAGLSNMAIQVSVMGTQLEYPEGLQSEIAARLSLNGTAPNLILTGNVQVLDALYRQDVDLRGEVLRRLTLQQSRKRGASTATRNGFGREIALDVRVTTTGPVAVAINVARLDLTGSFQVRGTLADPIVLGRADVLEGGEVFFGPASGEATALGERRDRYIVERGTLEFLNQQVTEPTIDFEATHELKVKNERYLIRLRLSGTPADLRTDLTSDPYLSEPDIIAMLLTGRSFSDLQSAHLAVAREQVLNYLSGELTSRFFQNAGEALGLDTMSIEPVNIASETDVSARLTLGKNITSDLNLVFSQNLSGARDQSWIVNYSAFRNFVLRGVNRTDQDQIRFELRHGLEFGGGPALARHVAPQEEARLNSVKFSGSTFPSDDLEDRVTQVGKPYNVYRMNDDVRALREFFSAEGYHTARVRARRTVSRDKIDVTFNITQGPRMRFEYHGVNVSRKTRQNVLRVWETGFAEAASLDESLRVLRRELRDEGFLEVQVTARNEAQTPDERLYVYQIEPGPKFDEPEWLFHGYEVSGITTNPGEVMDDPEAVKEQIESDLRAKGFLEATATVPELVKGNGVKPQFVVTVNVGPLYAVKKLHYSGNAFFTDDWLTYVVLVGPTTPGTTDKAVAALPGPVPPLTPFTFTEEWQAGARRRLLTEYWQQGFNDVQITSSTDFTPGSGAIDVTFEIREGERQMLSDIQIHGAPTTLPTHLRRYFRFTQNDPIDYTRINLTRKKLYDTGLFRRVDIEVVPETSGYVANVTLNERPAWTLNYGLSLSQNRNVAEYDIGLSGDIRRRNILGKGITAGLSLIVDSNFRDARVFSSFPVFLDRDVATTSAIFRTRETFADSVSNTWGVTLQQLWRPRDFYVLSYDYSLRRIATFETDLTDDDPNIVDGVVRLARFNVSLSRDTRNDILNATRGQFLSNSLQFAPPGIGSNIRYVRNYIQYLRFRPTGFSRMTWASAYRLGLAGSSEPLPITDQFNAADSLRAFGRDSLSFTPGNALLVTNQELRFPLIWRFGMAGFIDIGNNYSSVSTIRPFDLRYSPGIGLRVDTPFSMLRLDMAINPFPQTGERRRRFTFGIGQAF